MSIMLAAKMNTSCTSIQLAVERKGYTVHIHTAGVGGGERDIQCMSQVQSTGSGMGYTLLVQRQLLMVLFLLYDIEQSYVNAGEKLVRHQHLF